MSWVSLSCREQAVVALFERNTYSVVNIFDVTLVGGCASCAHAVHGRTMRARHLQARI
jgi:hypothetical protein